MSTVIESSSLFVPGRSRSEKLHLSTQRKRERLKKTKFPKMKIIKLLPICMQINRFHSPAGARTTRANRFRHHRSASWPGKGHRGHVAATRTGGTTQQPDRNDPGGDLQRVGCAGFAGKSARPSALRSDTNRGQHPRAGHVSVRFNPQDDFVVFKKRVFLSLKFKI